MTDVQTKKEYFERFVNLYREQQTLAEDVKALTEEVKESIGDEDLALLKQVAKLQATGKVNESYEKCEKTINLIEELTS